MKNKGFTLIELLAVIVILAIIAVIAIPRILNVVEEAKKGAAEASALGYIDAVEKQIMINATSKQHTEIIDNTYPAPLPDEYGVTVKGKAPDSGEIVIENGKVKTYSLVVDGYTISYDGTNKSVTKGEVEICSAYSKNEAVVTKETPGSDSFTPQCNGRYKLEVWGAQGGDVDDYHGGYGGYSVGNISLTTEDTLYLNVGGRGTTTTAGTKAGGNNGGGSIYVISSCGNKYGSGGGATHIAFEQGSLSTLEQYKGTLTNNAYYVSDRIIIVAGGGGGAGIRNCSASDNVMGNGAAGGGYMGATADFADTMVKVEATGGTQTSPGIGGTSNNETGAVNGSFGQGGSYTRTTNWVGQGGGGGGFYGGGLGMFTPGGGGSGYIANPKLKNKKMVMYETSNTYVSNDTETKTELTNQVSANAESNKAKSGNGAVKITYLGN